MSGFPCILGHIYFNHHVQIIVKRLRGISDPSVLFELLPSLPPNVTKLVDFCEIPVHYKAELVQLLHLVGLQVELTVKEGCIFIPVLNDDTTTLLVTLCSDKKQTLIWIFSYLFNYPVMGISLSITVW